MDFELKSLETLKYAQLQALCKKNGIKANQKKVKLIEELKNLHEENAPKEDTQDQKDIENDNVNEHKGASKDEAVDKEEPIEQPATEQQAPEQSGKDKVEPAASEESKDIQETTLVEPEESVVEESKPDAVEEPVAASIEKKEVRVDFDKAHEANLSKEPTIWEREELKNKEKENNPLEESQDKKKGLPYKPYTGPVPPFKGDSLFSPKRSVGNGSTKRPTHRTFVKTPKDGHEERMNRYILSNKKTSEEVRNQRRGL